MPMPVRREMSCMERWQDIFYRHPLQVYLLIVASVLEIASGGVLLAIYCASPAEKTQRWMLASAVLLLTVPSILWIVLITYILFLYQITDSVV